MRFHVVSLPHTQTTKAYNTCAYTQKVRKFCDMMWALGHVVYLYSGAQNEANCTEHIPCIAELDRQQIVGTKHYVNALTVGQHWLDFNAEVIAQVRKRIMPRDFICLIAGHAQKPIADAFPNNMAVEFGVGYSGFFSNYKVFESYAWMHMCIGARNPEPTLANGSAWDEVIPNYVDESEFNYNYDDDRNYYAYMGRFVDRKGYQIAIDICQRAGVKLKLAGPLPLENRSYGEYVGELGSDQRCEFLSKAKALLVPTQYFEPFGTVAVEAMTCGTPIICSDWGAFTETVPQHVGIRCKVMQDYLDAITQVELGVFLPDIIRGWATQFAMRNIAPRYEKYFRRLETLYDKGWYQVREVA